MMRPMTCLSLVAALGAGLYLYQEKHAAQLLDRDINRTIKQVEQERERIGLLKAEWALLNEPERLQSLAAQHLPSLQSLAPAQFARLDDLPGRLPAPSAVPVSAEPVDDAPVAAAASALPIRGPMPVLMAQAAPPAPPAPHPAARPAPKPMPMPVPMLAAAKPKEAAPAPRPLYAPVMHAYAPAPVLIHPPTVQTASAVAQPAPFAGLAPFAGSAPFVGSALGMARSPLAPPVPIAATPSGYASAR